MLRITGINMPLDKYQADEEVFLKNIVCRKLNIQPQQLKSIQIVKRSIDARKKSAIQLVFSVDVELTANEPAIAKRLANKGVSLRQAMPKTTLSAVNSSTNGTLRPLVVGAGPAGLFAALILAEAGQNPLLLERGKQVEQRRRDVEHFWQSGELNTASNVQFGEGGAGTFSDGKLTTNTHDPRIGKVLREFVRAGAPEEILYDSMPHIGTDCLQTVVKGLRKRIEELGGEVCFSSQLIDIKAKQGRLQAVLVANPNGTMEIAAEQVILAIGHSARDTFALLHERQISLEQKAFSLGLRIEHLQAQIDAVQYGDYAGHPALGAATYKLAVHLPNGRSVYTFCMCPGGSVVAAASEEGHLVTNGMSYYDRKNTNANSALLVGINTKDFASSHPLAGVELQRSIERQAFLAAGGAYRAPVQRMADFLINKNSTCFGEVLPSYLPGTSFVPVDEYLPSFITESLRMAVPEMNKKLPCFGLADALLTGPETRSSSPLRILRGENRQSISLAGLYPCGEGAGYAGGIISAAVDGIKCAEQLLAANGISQQGI